MRSAFCKHFLFFAFICGAIGARAQVNPQTQIRWPAGCAAAGMVYNFQSNTCVPLVGVTWRGNYTPGTYALNDMVSSGGTTYISTAAGNTTAPPSASWSIMAASGATGPTGPPGPAFNGGTITNALNTPTSIGSAQPLLDIRHPSFAGGGICDNATDIGPAVQAAVNVLGALGGEIIFPGSPVACYWANPTTLTFPTSSSTYTFIIQGTLRLGSTWVRPARIALNILGRSASGKNSFQGPGQSALISLSPLTGTCRATLGTAVLPSPLNTNGTQITGTWSSGSNSIVVSSATGVNPVVIGMQLAAANGTIPAGTTVTNIAGTTVTISANTTGTGTGNILTSPTTVTPSQMNCIYPGAAIAAGANCSPTINTISRASNLVTANVTFPAGCRTPAGDPITVAGVTDSTFNGTHIAGVHNFQIKTSDYGTGTLTWSQPAGQPDASSSGGTVTAFNSQNEENVFIDSTTGTTFNATFYHAHDATDEIGVDAIAGGVNTGEALIKDIAVTNPYGTAMWIRQEFGSTFENVGLSTTGLQTGHPANWPLEINVGQFLNFKHVGILAGDAPWSVHVTQGYFDPNSGAGGQITFREGSFVGNGVMLDHGSGSVKFFDSTVDQVTRAAIAFDPTNYWNASNVSTISMENVGWNDNGGFTPCWIYATSTALSGAISTPIVNLKHVANMQCVANDYFSGKLVLQQADASNPKYGQTIQRGVLGTFNNGVLREGESRGVAADMHPAIIPYPSLNVTTNPASWTGGCANNPGILAPDGTATAGSLTIVAGANQNTILNYTVTPAVGDMMLFGGWTYNSTVGGSDTGGNAGSPFTVDVGSGSHFTWLGFTGNATANPYDPLITDDWTHPLVGFLQVGTADGSSTTIHMFIGCTFGQTQNYWQPFAIYIPASAGIPLREVLRWRTQLLHGWVPANGTTGIAYSNYPIALPADPTTALQAATKQYVDAHAGGTITGPGSATVGHLATWANAGGTVLADGGTAVNGPASTTVGHLATWNNTSGGLLADGGVAPAVPAIPFQTPALVEQIWPIFSGTGISAPMNGCTSQTANIGQAATSTSPILNQMTSGATSGNCVGAWSGSSGAVQPEYYQTRNPVVQWGFGFSASTDYTSSARVWIGLVDGACSLATFTGSDTPACSYGAIRSSTSAADATWECVSDSGTGTPQVTAIGATVPTAAYQTAKVAITATTVTCTVGATSVTNATKVPTNKPFYDIIANTTLANVATHLRLANIYGYSAGGAF